jgi:formylglycine-generating enzyme required for sulfatase activity
MDRFEGAKSLTKTGGIIGTLDYASPEQLEAKGEFGRTSEATDVWGWAVTLAFALTGESPFARDNSLETAAAILNSDWSFENQSKRSRKAQALVQMGLRRDPEERESFAEILAALASDPPQSSLRFSFSWIFVVLLLLASILIFSVSGLLREPPRLLEIEPFPERSNARECRIRGRLSKPGLTLNLGSKTATSDSEGRFEFLMTLNEGKNGWSLRYGETTLKTIKIEVDRAPPRIAMDAQSEGGPLDWPEGGILRGQVSATSKVQLWLGDQAVEVEANGSFSLTPAPRARAQMIRLEASDSLNQRTQLEFTLSSPLDDRRRWNELSIEQQDELIREVEKSLGKQFSWLETKTYKTEALSFRIATFEHRQSGIKMNLIPGGTITIGTSDPAPLRSIFESDYTAWRLWAKQTYGWDYPAEIPKEWIESPTPARKISMRAFLVSATETDQGQWDSLRGSDSRINRGSDYPIEGVSIRDIRLWILKLDSELRLPSEVEWEYACRGGDEGHFGFGNNPEELKDYAACWRNRLPSSAPVARRKPNAFGLYDMHGNVWEWCEDNWHKSYEGAPKDASPWMSSDAEEGRLNVRRGGSFLYSAMELRSAARSANKSDDRSFYIGFRLVKSLD